MRVIEVRTRRCVDVRRYDGERWVECGGYQGGGCGDRYSDDRDRDGCRDRDYAYDRRDDRYDRRYVDRTGERDRGDYYGRDDNRDRDRDYDDDDDDEGEWRR